MKKDMKKNLMKRIVAMITAAVMLFSLAAFAACSKKQDDTEIRIAALKGPTGMGMVKLADKQNYPNYTVSIEASPDALNPRIISGEVDVAAVPVNLASVLYNKLDGDISVLAVSTLGVLYVVEAGSEVNSVADLAGKTVYATGQGATPEYILNYLLDKNGVAGSVEVNYVGEHAALATMLADGSAEIGMLPEPNVTSTLAGNDNLRIALNLTEEWNKVCSTELVQGVVIARKSFVNEHPEAIEQFLREYEKSSAFVNENIDEAAKLIVDAGILGNVEIAKKAIPNCNISFSKGEAMHKAVEGMLTVLFEANPKSIGGKLPDKDFYYGI
ncbi:MAG: ABC transporter substrate-binding protein [Christensenellales bacterium]|jgi:NitT/TauT family transport system substrate-binding protein|nr:ABC transporter substrate-binding protein [Christensenellaceae bacterium]